MYQTALRSSVIKRIRQIDVKYITHMQSVLAKMEMYTKKGIRKVKKWETVVLRMIYIYIYICSNDSSRLWWNWHFCKDLKIGVTPFSFHRSRKANNNNLHWLAIKKRIDYKMIVLAFIVLNEWTGIVLYSGFLQVVQV